MPSKPGADVIESLYSAARDLQKWPEALSQLAAHTGAGSAMMARCDSRGIGSVMKSLDRLRLVMAADISGDIDHVAKHVARHLVTIRDKGDNPAEPPPVLVVPGKGGTDGEHTHLVLPHPGLCGTGRAGWISIALAPGTIGQREQALQHMLALRGHLIRALDISLEMTGLRHAGLPTATLLSALPTAALILETSARIAEANVAARAILRDQNGVLETPGRQLRASIAREDQRLAPAIQAALAASRGEQATWKRQVVRIRRPIGTAPLLIILDPVPRHDLPLFLDETGDAVLVRMIDEDHAPDGRTFPLQAAFDLTAAEARIAAAIGSGRSTALTALQLDLSTNTVRTHLARIFDKTGTRSQHALTRLLAAIGSWPLP